MRALRTLAAALLAAALSALALAPTPASAQASQITASAILNAQATTDALCAANSCLSIPVAGFEQMNGESTCWVDVSGTYTGTMYAEIAGASGNWYQVPITTWSGGSATSATQIASTAAIASFPAGPQGCRIRMESYTKGPAAVTLTASAASTAQGVSNTALSGTSAVNVSQVQGSTLAEGVPVQFFGKADTVGQPCWGMSAATGTEIISTNETTAVTASTTTLVLGLTASEVIHVCALSLSATFSTAGLIELEYGTQTTNPCDTGTTVIANYYFGIASETLAQGNGAQDLFSIPAAQQLCVVGGTFVGTAYLNVDTAKY